MRRYWGRNNRGLVGKVASWYYILMICDSCRNAGILSSKDLSDLKYGYEYVIHTGHFKGTFIEWVIDIDRRIKMFHGMCKGPLQCNCQHKIANVIRDLT